MLRLSLLNFDRFWFDFLGNNLMSVSIFTRHTTAIRKVSVNYKQQIQSPHNRWQLSKSTHLNNRCIYSRACSACHDSNFLSASTVDTTCLYPGIEMCSEILPLLLRGRSFPSTTGVAWHWPPLPGQWFTAAVDWRELVVVMLYDHDFDLTETSVYKFA